VLRMLLAQAVARDVEATKLQAELEEVIWCRSPWTSTWWWPSVKNGRAKAVRFTTLAALCEVLECQPGDLLRWVSDDAAPGV